MYINIINKIAADISRKRIERMQDSRDVIGQAILAWYYISRRSGSVEVQLSNGNRYKLYPDDCGTGVICDDITGFDGYLDEYNNDLVEEIFQKVLDKIDYGK